MTIHTLYIPGWLPWSDNKLKGGLHWAVVNRRKQADKEMVAMYALQQGVPRATGKRRLSVAFTAPAAHQFDPLNLMKSLCDALVACRALKDDRARDCEIGSVTMSPGPSRSTTVTLEEIDP